MTAEARPLQRRLEGLVNVGVRQVGIALADWADDVGPAVISCGVAGGLDRQVQSGDVIIPDTVGLADGRTAPCDAELVSLLRAGAAGCGVQPHPGPLLTTDHIVRGDERATWSRSGYAAVDMETGLLLSRVDRFAAVRVVLDTPRHELSAAWRRPRVAMLQPWLWRQAWWLARVVPARCDLAAAIVAAALAPSRSGRDPGTSGPPARPGE